MVKKRKIIGMHEERLVCDECGTEMRCNEVLLSCPAQYVYYCPKCHKREVYQEKYHRVVYEYEEEQ